jgi:two-component system NarL family response regulator
MAQAVALYQQHRPDVAILDLSMPRLNGVEAIEQIRAFDDSASIVILTTYQGDEDVYRGLRAGAKAYLLEDGGSDQLLDCICTVASGQQFLPRGRGQQAGATQGRQPAVAARAGNPGASGHRQGNKMIARSADESAPSNSTS